MQRHGYAIQTPSFEHRQGEGWRQCAATLPVMVTATASGKGTRKRQRPGSNFDCRPSSGTLAAVAKDPSASRNQRGHKARPTQKGETTCGTCCFFALFGEEGWTRALFVPHSKDECEKPTGTALSQKHTAAPPPTKALTTNTTRTFPRSSEPGALSPWNASCASGTGFLSG